MNTSGQRINERMKQLGLTQAELTRATHAARSTIHGWINDVSQPTGQRLFLLAKALKTNPEWILTGAAISGMPETLPPDARGVEEWDDDTPLDDDEFEVPFFKDFLVSCGSGTVQEALQNERRKLRMGKQTARRLGVSMSACAAVTADGDSMAHTINDGDTVTIDTDKTRIKDGKIFAICYGGHFYFKRLYNQPFGGVKIVSDNKSGEYPDIELTKEQLDNYEFKVIGQVWSIQRIEPL